MADGTGTASMIDNATIMLKESGGILLSNVHDMRWFTLKEQNEHHYSVIPNFIVEELCTGI